MTIDQWAELWFRRQVETGTHPGVALSALEDFRRWLAAPASRATATPPRIINQTDRYIVVELITDRGADSTLAIFCRRCGSTSFCIGDVQQLFCSHCQQFHS